MYVSKVWGFDVPCGPMVFETRVWRDRAVGMLNDGNRVVLVGTVGKDTPEPDKSRLQGATAPPVSHQVAGYAEALSADCESCLQTG